jgi:Ca2+-binding RTX toxin-like protein
MKRPYRYLTFLALATLVIGVVAATGGRPSHADSPGTCGGDPVTITGTPGDDVIQGTDGEDVVDGLGGNDTINGMGGDDTICGGDGTNSMDGGSGDDECVGGPGPGDTVTSCEETHEIP